MLLLDTHALVFLASDQRKLPRRAKQTLRAHAGELFVSAISALEITLLVKRRRLVLPLPPEAFVERALAHHDVHEVPLERQLACASVSLPDLHNDPFDRIIVATALAHHMTILTKDRLIPTYPGVRAAWG